jgi:hypothetical protein
MNPAAYNRVAMKLPFDSGKSKTGYGISWRAMKWYYISVLAFIGGILLLVFLLWVFHK